MGLAEMERYWNEFLLLSAQHAAFINQANRKFKPRKKATPMGGFSLQHSLIRSV